MHWQAGAGEEAGRGRSQPASETGAGKGRMRPETGAALPNGSALQVRAGHPGLVISVPTLHDRTPGDGQLNTMDPHAAIDTELSSEIRALL